MLKIRSIASSCITLDSQVATAINKSLEPTTAIDKQLKID